MGITSGNESSHQPEEEEEEGTSYFDELPETIEMCVRNFGENDPLTLKFKQELIDLTQALKDNPNLYEEDQEGEDEWHAGMVPNLRPKSEKGLEEEDWDDELEESPEDEEDGPAEEED